MTKSAQTRVAQIGGEGGASPSSSTKPAKGPNWMMIIGGVFVAAMFIVGIWLKSSEADKVKAKQAQARKVVNMKPTPAQLQDAPPAPETAVAAQQRGQVGDTWQDPNTGVRYVVTAVGPQSIHTPVAQDALKARLRQDNPTYTEAQVDQMVASLQTQSAAPTLGTPPIATGGAGPAAGSTTAVTPSSVGTTSTSAAITNPPVTAPTPTPAAEPDPEAQALRARVRSLERALANQHKAQKQKQKQQNEWEAKQQQQLYQRQASWIDRQTQQLGSVGKPTYGH